MSMTILVVDDEEHFRLNVCQYLTGRGYEVLGASSLQEARDHISRGTSDIVLLDARLPDGWGPDLLEETAHLPARPPIILITAYGDIDMAVEAMKSGAHDFLQKPILQFATLEKSIQRAREIVAMRRELFHLRNAQHREKDFIVGKSQAMLEVLDYAQRAAQKSVSVLITGDTGTGKEVLAKAIHRMGPRKDKPFIGINCAAIQSTVLESELFGYEPGAFTSAEKRKLGLMEVAEGGILFLDEISAMPPEMQAKLLRALQDRSFMRVGGTKLIQVDLQVLAASNRDLKAMIANGTFREDLYYRLKVVDLHLPALCERADDIPALVGSFMHYFNRQMGVNITGITPLAMKALLAYPWPGNIRELRNAIERAMLFCDDPSIDIPHLSSEITKYLDKDK